MIPARMVNEYVYCPRLFALEHLDGQWADSADTVRGRRIHRRVDSRDDRPLDGLSDAPVVRRSVDLGSEALGVVARLDLVEIDGDKATPVDYKKGRVPKGGPWDPERVQLCLQALLLREHGYLVSHGVLYFAGSRRRVEVEIDSALVELSRSAILGAQALLDSPALPPPLKDSPRCPRCSLVGICLPDEQQLLVEGKETVRPMAPARHDGVPLYVEHRGAKLALRGGEIAVIVDGKVSERVRILHTTAVIIRGAVSITTPLLHALAEARVSVSLQRWSGWHVAEMVPISGHHALGRVAQHRVASDPERAIEVARSIVVGKIRNQRVLLRRNGQGDRREDLARMKALADDARCTSDVEVLLGQEGAAARVYFQAFSSMVRSAEFGERFDVNGRNRRPPLDPLNALLSYAYGVLARECTGVLHRVGLDPYVGIFHRLRPGRAALALDLMEEFRPVIADSAVLRSVNTGVLSMSDFYIRSTGVRLKDSGRRRFIRTIEDRFSEEIVHPLFGYRMSYRRILEVQARLLSKAFLAEIDGYTPFRIR